MCPSLSLYKALGWDSHDRHSYIQYTTFYCLNVRFYYSFSLKLNTFQTTLCWVWEFPHNLRYVKYSERKKGQCTLKLKQLSRKEVLWRSITISTVLFKSKFSGNEQFISLDCRNSLVFRTRYLYFYSRIYKICLLRV